MKNNHSNKNSTEFRSIWYLNLLVWPAITSLMFIVAGSGNDQPSSLAQAQPSISAAAATLVSDASADKTTAR